MEKHEKNTSPRRRLKPQWFLLLLIPALVISVLLLTGSTLAQPAAAHDTGNEPAPSKDGRSIELINEFDPPSNLQPGVSFPQTVGATNTGTIPGFVRLLVFPAIFIDYPSGRKLLPAQIGKEVLLDIDTANWMLGEDGYYYYLDRLMPGQTTPPLCTTITLADASVLTPEYYNAKVNFEIKGEFVNCQEWSYRDAWWGKNAAPPSTGNLGHIENTLGGLVK